MTRHKGTSRGTNVHTLKLRRRNGRRKHQMQRQIRDLKDELASQRADIIAELDVEVVEVRERVAELTIHVCALVDEIECAQRVIDRRPDARERAAVNQMGLLARIAWAWGVIRSARFGWQRDGEEASRA